MDLFTLSISFLILVYGVGAMIRAIRMSDRLGTSAFALLSTSALLQILWVWMLRTWPWGIRGDYTDRFFYTAALAGILAAVSFFMAFKMEGLLKIVQLTASVLAGAIGFLNALYSIRLS